MAGIVRIAKLVLLGLFGGLAVSGIQWMFAAMTPIMGTVYEIAMTVLVLYLWRMRLGAKFHSLPTYRAAAARLVLSSALCSIAVIGAQEYWVRPEVPSYLDGARASTWIAVSGLLAALVAAPLLEEALFRGFLLGRLREHLTPISAAIISAATFAIAHGEPLQTFGRFFAGLVLAAITIRTGRLWLAAIAHGVINLSGVLVGGARALQLPEQMGMLYPVLWLVIAIVAALVLWRELRQTRWAGAMLSTRRGVAPPVTWNPDPTC